MIIHVDRPDDPRIALYRGVSDPELLLRGGRFVAEGRQVVRRLLETGRFAAESVLVTPAALAGMVDVLVPAATRVPVYVAPRDVLVHVAGYNIHRGCLAMARRPAPADWETILPPPFAPALIVVLEAVANADNVGGVFRNAQSFGAHAVLLDPATCDPLYRKAIRTSMGASLAVPFARVIDWPRGLAALRQAGFVLAALTPRPDATDIASVGGPPADDARNEAPRTNQEPRTPDGPRTRNQEPGTVPASSSRFALLVGNEGGGLSEGVEAMADLRVRIPMARGADSLNAATATGIALHAFARYCGLL